MNFFGSVVLLSEVTKMTMSWLERDWAKRVFSNSIGWIIKSVVIAALDQLKKLQFPHHFRH